MLRSGPDRRLTGPRTTARLCSLKASKSRTAVDTRDHPRPPNDRMRVIAMPQRWPTRKRSRSVSTGSARRSERFAHIEGSILGHQHRTSTTRLERRESEVLLTATAQNLRRLDQATRTRPTAGSRWRGQRRCKRQAELDRDASMPRVTLMRGGITDRQKSTDQPTRRTHDEFCNTISLKADMHVSASPLPSIHA